MSSRHHEPPRLLPFPYPQPIPDTHIDVVVPRSSRDRVLSIDVVRTGAHAPIVGGPGQLVLRSGDGTSYILGLKPREAPLTGLSSRTF
jgi:hypothetical protein